jgi:hypothetical protein
MSKAKLRARAKKSAATRRANREAAEARFQEIAVSTSGRPSGKRKSKRFLSDDEKGKLVGFFFAQPGKVYETWDAVRIEIAETLGVDLSGKQAERLRVAFSLPFDVRGETEGDATCEKRLERIEGILLEGILRQISAKVDAWDE